MHREERSGNEGVELPAGRARTLALGTILAGIVTLVTFGLGEVLVRLAKPRILSEDFAIILGTLPMQADDHGAVRFLPRAEGRYALATTHGLEYDVRFATNNHGYVDDHDYPLAQAGTRTIAFVGDSYSVGLEGGEAWVPKLRERTGTTLYNLGMPGTGVMHFDRALASFRRTAEFSEIVIVATSDDFFRPLWKPLAHQGGVRLCAPGVTDADCARRDPQFYTVGLDAPPIALQEAAAEVRRRFASSPSVVRSVLRMSALLRFLSRLPSAGQLVARYRAYEANVAALHAIRARFPNATIRMVHVPDKYESAAGRYTVDVAQTLGELRIGLLRVLDACPLSPGMFYPRDNHPNAAGYRKLAECVSNYLQFDARGKPRARSAAGVALTNPACAPPQSRGVGRSTEPYVFPVENFVSDARAACRNRPGRDPGPG